MPKSQPLQVAEPFVVVVRPGVHRWHWVAMSFSFRANPTGHCWQPWPNVPAPQATHLALPLSACLPTPHDTHVEDPSPRDFVLTAQSVQFVLKVAPGRGFFFPAAHLLQSSTLLAPMADEYVPDGHSAQAALSETRLIASKFGVPYLPAPHESHTRSLTNFPCVHSSHLLSP